MTLIPRTSSASNRGEHLCGELDLSWDNRQRPDGWIRALTSRWLDGASLGDPAHEGVRADDPNDVTAHDAFWGAKILARLSPAQIRAGAAHVLKDRL